MKYAIECFECGDPDEQGYTHPTYTHIAVPAGSTVAPDVDAVCGQCRGGRVHIVRMRERGDPVEPLRSDT